MWINVVKNTEISISESVARKKTETPDENIDTEEEMRFDELTITGDYIDNDILEEEKGNHIQNYEVWVKTKKEIRRGGLLSFPYIKKIRAANI